MAASFFREKRFAMYSRSVYSNEKERKSMQQMLLDATEAAKRYLPAGSWHTSRWVQADFVPRGNLHVHVHARRKANAGPWLCRCIHSTQQGHRQLLRRGNTNFLKVQDKAQDKTSEEGVFEKTSGRARFSSKKLDFLKFNRGSKSSKLM